MTIISTPTWLAALAMEQIFSASKSNRVASQLLMRMGRRWSFQGPRHRLRRMARWNWRLMWPSPWAENTIAASGVVKDWPGWSFQRKWKGLIPRVKRVSWNWVYSVLAWKLPE